MNALNLLGSILICLLPCFFIFFSIFSDKLRLPIWAGILICLALIGSAFASALLTLQEPGFYWKWRCGISFFFVALFMAALFCIFKYSFTQQLFFLFMLRNYLDTVNLFLCSAQRLISENWLAKDNGFYIIYGRFFFTLITAPLLWLFTKKILRPILDRTEQMAFWKLIWLLPFFHFLIYQLSIEITNHTASTCSTSIALPLVWAICTFLTYYLVLHMISETAQKNLISEQLHTSEIRIVSQEKQFDTLKDKIEYTRRAQHDMRHLLLGIQKYAKEKDFDGLENYLAQSETLLSVQTELSFCPNKSIDAVVCYFTALAKKHGIQTSIKAAIPETIVQSESDVCIIIGNLLENALEACLRIPGQEDYIHFSANYSDNHALSISITNSFYGKVSQENNVFSSSKRTGPGIGIASIRNIAEKYCGLTKFEYDQCIFRSNVYLTSLKVK